MAEFTAGTSDSGSRALLKLDLSEISTSSSTNVSTIRIIGTLSDNSTNLGGFGSANWRVYRGTTLVGEGSVSFDFTDNSGRSYEFYRGDHPITHATNGTGSASAKIEFDGTSGKTVGSAEVSGSITLTDFVRVPTTPNRPVLSRSNNGATLTITGSTATFRGTGGYYEYQTSTNGTTWSTAATLGANRVSTVTVTNTNTMYARTRARDSEGIGAYSVASLASFGVPFAPSVPLLTRAADGASVDLNIITGKLTGQNDATAYSYRQSTDGTNWGSTIDIAAGASGVVITGLTFDQTYYYQVLGRSSVGSSDWSGTTATAGVLPSITSSTVASPVLVGSDYKTTGGGNVTITADRVRTFSVKEGTALPPGLSINATTGVISGTPTAAGSFSFVILATNDVGSVESPSRTIVVNSSARVWIGSPTNAFRFGLVSVWVERVAPATSGFVSGIIRVWDGTTWKSTN